MAAVLAAADCSDGLLAPGLGCRVVVVGGDADEGACAVAAGCGLSFGGEFALGFDAANGVASGFSIAGGVDVGGAAGAVAIGCADFDSAAGEGTVVVGFPAVLL